jgi:hypothetical protein
MMKPSFEAKPLVNLSFSIVPIKAVVYIELEVTDESPAFHGSSNLTGNLVLDTLMAP